MYGPARMLLTSRSATQEAYLATLRKSAKPWIVVANGPAGTGKTHLATAVGLERLRAREVERLVITRPVVPADEDIGFLPGTLEDKMKPWVQPVFDALRSELTPMEIDKMFARGLIEIAPLAFMRGRTLEHSWIVCDEAQNCTTSQLLMLMTRIGVGSKMIVAGDVSQSDRKDRQDRQDWRDRKDRHHQIGGFETLIDRLRAQQEHPAAEERKEDRPIELIEFDAPDIVRHPVIPHVLDLFAFSAGTCT